MDIQLLYKEGHSIRQIAKATGFSRNTVRNILRRNAPQPFQTPERPSKLDPFKDYLRARYWATGLNSKRLLEEIRAQGFTGSIIILRRFLRTLKTGALAEAKATVRFETPPGHQAQVDWAYCGRFPDAAGCQTSVYAFVMVLGYSRMTYTAFTTSMDLPTLVDCHLRAFEFFGGIPAEILYDNMKQVRLAPGRLNPLFIDFASRHGFAAKTHRPYRPRTKGKVERTVHYLKNNFLAGRSFADLADLNAQARHWLDHVANVRIHGTTEQRPIDLFAQETLQPLPSGPPYRVVPLIQRRVDNESFVSFQKSRYSVPPEHCGKSVEIELHGDKVIIRSCDLILAEHDKADKPGSCVAEEAHLQELWKRSTAATQAPLPSWQIRFDQAVAATPLSVYEKEVA